jgi:hypothetical protein
MRGSTFTFQSYRFVSDKEWWLETGDEKTNAVQVNNLLHGKRKMGSNGEKVQWEENLEYYLKDASGEIDHDFDFTIICNSKHIVVTISPNQLHRGRAATLLSRYSQADDDDINELENIERDILDIIYKAGWQKFKRIAPTIPPSQKCPSIGFTENLHLDLNRETFHFKLISVGEKEEITESFPSNPGLPLLDVRGDALGLSRYSSRDIVTISKLPSTGFVAKICVGELVMCCKILTAKYLKAVQREYDCLSQIMLADNGTSIPTPRLLGLVVDDDGAMIGILQTFIENDGTLSNVFKREVAISKDRIEKWIQQITQAVEDLHNIGIVWGDGKPENIIVGSKQDDCFLVDFGGSQTNGWVDIELMETREGDQQAVERIAEFLRAGQ